MRRLVLTTVTLALAAAPAAPAAGSSAPALLRLDGIGPLKLGMTRAAGVATRWLAHRGSGCPLGGKPYPVTYHLNGAKAPLGLTGTAEFVAGKLNDISFSKGVRTTTGVVVGRTTVTDMVRRYRAAGFNASGRFDATFAGTFVTVRRHGRTVLQGFARKHTVETLAIPEIAVCE